MNRLSGLGTSFDDSFSNEDFLAFKNQLQKVQQLISEYKEKMVEQTLCAEDLDNMQTEMKHLAVLEQKVTSEKIKSNYLTYKTASLKLIQESYRLCNSVLDKQFSEVDSVFSIDTFVEKIFKACEGKEDPLDHINTLFSGVMKNTNYFNLNFYGNVQPNEYEDSSTLTQCKKEKQKSQKRQLEELVVPDEAQNDMTCDNELQITLKRVNRCLKRAILENHGKPISFYKFAIDPFSLTYTVENLFNLASLVKDGIIIIERVPGDNHNEFTTITIAKNKNTNKDNKIYSRSFFTINEDKWKYYIKKFNITERMIEQDE